MSKKKSIVFLNENLEIGKPIYSRIEAYRRYFSKHNFIESKKNKKTDYIFYSMPPFRNFGIFFKCRKRVILDIRDGWSIAQASGYGGTVKSKPIKAFFTRIVERFMIRRSFIAIACTQGLVKHLEQVSKREILLIPNGVSEDRIKLINQFKNKKIVNPNDELIFVCAGQFSEYGQDKVKKLLKIISTRYDKNRLLIQLIGSNKEKNSWLGGYFTKLTNDRGRVEILPKMNEKELFIKMLNADYGLVTVRDPQYELGTKVYDYIALGLPVVNYFDKPNNFTNYFDACLDRPFLKNSIVPEINRSNLIEDALKNIKF